MMLNTEQILERKVLRLENSKGAPSQIGYDLSVKEIKSIDGVGKIRSEKTELPKYKTVKRAEIFPVDELNQWDGDDSPPITPGWYLDPGFYEVTFWEGCDIPNNLVGLMRQRSSMMRSGTLLHSSVFDPGFSTDNMGSFIAVFRPIFIEVNARVAQMYFHECEPVSSDKLYKGQFQNDKQRKGN